LTGARLVARGDGVAVGIGVGVGLALGDGASGGSGSSCGTSAAASGWADRTVGACWACRSRPTRVNPVPITTAVAPATRVYRKRAAEIDTTPTIAGSWSRPRRPQMPLRIDSGRYKAGEWFAGPVRYAWLDAPAEDVAE